MVRIEAKQDECDVGADLGVDGVILFVAKQVAELGHDVGVRQELVSAEQVVEVIDLVGELRQLEQGVRGVCHEDCRRHQEAGLDLGVVIRQLREQDLELRTKGFHLKLNIHGQRV